MKIIKTRYRLVSKLRPTAEAKELAALARQLSTIEMPSLDKSTKASMAADIGFGYNPRRSAIFRGVEGALACMVVIVLVFAQTAQPGSALYNVKQGTTKVRTFVEDKVPFINESNDENHAEVESHQRGKDPSVSNDNNTGSGDAKSADDSTKGDNSNQGSGDIPNVLDSSSGSSGKGSGDSSNSGSDSGSNVSNDVTKGRHGD